MFLEATGTEGKAKTGSDRWRLWCPKCEKEMVMQKCETTRGIKILSLDAFAEDWMPVCIQASCLMHYELWFDSFVFKLH